jgi:hypothetical protein
MLWGYACSYMLASTTFLTLQMITTQTTINTIAMVPH